MRERKNKMTYEELRNKFIQYYMECCNPYGVGSSYFWEYYPRKEWFFEGLAEAYTPEEMELYVKASEIGAPFLPEELEKRCSAAEFGKEFQNCLDKMLLRIYHDGNPVVHYTTGCMSVIYNYSGNKLHPVIRDYLHEAIYVGYGGKKMDHSRQKRKYKVVADPGSVKHIEIGEPLEDKRCVGAIDDLIEHIKHQDAFGLAPCTCRMVAEEIEGVKCENPGKCMCLNENALYLEEVFPGSLITMEEAIEYVIEGGKRGLVHLTDNVNGKANVICSCCSCCCTVMKSVQRGEVHLVKPSEYLAMYNPAACVKCGECVKVCPSRALRLENGAIQLEHSLCLGCGNCATVCHSGSMKMKLRENHQEYQSEFADYSELWTGGWWAEKQKPQE